MSEYSSPSRESARRVGQHIKRGWQNFLDHWQEWMGPMLIAAAIASIITVLGMYIMYVGLIATIPLGLTILVSVYEERYGGKASDGGRDSSGLGDVLPTR